MAENEQQSRKLSRKISAVTLAGALSVCCSMPALTADAADIKPIKGTIPVTKEAVGWYTTEKMDNSKYTLYAIKVPESGVLSVSPISASAADGTKLPTRMKLYNSSKVSIADSKDGVLINNSGYKDGTEYPQMYGVKRGTYYLGFKPKGNLLALGIDYTPVSMPKNTKKSKATVLKKGGKYKMKLFAAGSVKSHWFKVKQKKTGKLKFTINAGGMMDGGNASSGKSKGLKVQVYCGSKKVGKTQTLNKGYKSTFTVTYRAKKGKARKGTYYLKVTNANKYANGVYQIKVNK